MPHILIPLGSCVFSMVYAIPPKPSTVRKAVSEAVRIAPGLSVSYRDNASGAWYRITKLTEEKPQPVPEVLP
jgi:hypothetical protein